MHATDLAVEIMGCSDNSLSVSHYFEMPNNGLLRVSNHLPKGYNLQENNEGVNRIFLMFTDSVTEEEVENSGVIEEIEAMGVEVSWSIYDEEFGAEYAKMKIAKFFN